MNLLNPIKTRLLAMAALALLLAGCAGPVTTPESSPNWI